MIMTDIELTPDQVERAISILERERNALVISKHQQRSLLWLRISSAVLFISYTALIATMLTVGTETFVTDLEHFDGLQITWIALSVVSSLSFLTTISLLLLNSKLILNLIRQRRLIRRVGLGGFQKSLWRRYKPARKLLDYCTTGGAILGALFLVFAVLFVATFALIEPDNLFTGLILGIVYAALGVALIAPGFIHRLKQRVELLADVERLRRLFQQMTTMGATREAPAVHVSRRDAEQLSAIEAAQINRERAQAIQEREQVHNEYTLRVSREVLDQRSKLDLETRLKLEESLESLLEQPRPGAAEQLPASVRLKIKVPDTGMKLVYEVDEVHRQVKAIALEPEGATSPMATAEKDHRNA